MEETKNKVWKPPVFKTSIELENKVNQYFESWYRKKKVFTTAWVEVIIPKITMTDLAIFLWFDSRQSLYDYEDKKEYSYIIKRARLFIEREYEERLEWQYSSWAIFALKNMWWIDKQEIDNNNSNVDVTDDLTEEQRKKIASRYK
jgi:hypothetical protein